MRELTKSIGSFSWAMSLFGVRQMANVLCPSRAAEAFDSVSEATEGELGDFLRSAHEVGDRMQRSFVDMTFGMLSMEMLDPRSWTRTVGEMTGGAARAMADMASPGAAASAAVRETGWGPMPPAPSAAPPASRPAASGGGNRHDAAPSAQDGWGPMGP
jgi:hypothetical protein